MPDIWDPSQVPPPATEPNPALTTGKDADYSETWDPFHEQIGGYIAESRNPLEPGQGVHRALGVVPRPQDYLETSWKDYQQAKSTFWEGVRRTKEGHYIAGPLETAQGALNYAFFPVNAAAEVAVGHPAARVTGYPMASDLASFAATAAFTPEALSSVSPKLADYVKKALAPETRGFFAKQSELSIRSAQGEAEREIAQAFEKLGGFQKVQNLLQASADPAVHPRMANGLYYTPEIREFNDYLEDAGPAPANPLVRQAADVLKPMADRVKGNISTLDNYLEQQWRRNYAPLIADMEKTKASMAARGISKEADSFDEFLRSTDRGVESPSAVPPAGGVPPSPPAGTRAMTPSQEGISPHASRTGFLQRRASPTISSFVDSGGILKTADPIDQWKSYIENGHRFYANQKILQDGAHLFEHTAESGEAIKNTGVIRWASSASESHIPPGWKPLRGQFTERVIPIQKTGELAPEIAEEIKHGEIAWQDPGKELGTIRQQAFAPEEFATVYNRWASAIPYHI